MIGKIKEEIQRQLQESEERLSHIKARGWVAPNEEQLIIHLKSLLSFIDVLEVKEVELEHEVDFYWKQCDMTWCRDAYSMTHIRSMLSDIAKHFFELGLQARTDKELVEEIYSHLDAIKETADRMTSGNFMHHRAAIKFSANTIAKVLELMGLKAQKGEDV